MSGFRIEDARKSAPASRSSIVRTNGADNRPATPHSEPQTMKRFILTSTAALLATVGLFAMPNDAKAQVGISVGTPGFGFSLGVGGQPAYRPYPVAPVAVAPAYPVYSPGYPVYAPRPYVPYCPVGPVYGPNHGWHNHGPVHTPYYGGPHRY